MDDHKKNFKVKFLKKLLIILANSCHNRKLFSVICIEQFVEVIGFIASILMSSRNIWLRLVLMSLL